MEQKDSKFCGCLFYSANALSRVITKMAEEEYAITGLSPSYAFLLMIVNEKPGVQPKEISEQMQLQPSTVTRFLEKLEAKKYVTREQSGRSVAVYPTEKSNALDADIKLAWKNLYKRYVDILGEETAQKLTSEAYIASQKLTE